MHRSYELQGSLKRRYKHPSPTSINGYHTAKKLLSQSPAKRPTFAFMGESGYTLAFANRIAHSGLHGETRAFRMGVVSLPSERSTRFGNPAWPGFKTANFAAFGSWSETLLKNAESLRSSDALMRVAVPKASRPRWAALLCLQFGDVAVFSLCAQGFPHMRKRGWYHYPRCALRVLKTLDGRVSEGQTLPLLGLGRRRARRTQRACGTAMRLCASLFRGVAAPLGCVIQ